MNMTPERLVDRYSFVRFLGEGESRRVWLARDDRLMREVAIKHFTPPVLRGDAPARRMRKLAVREAQAASQISHPNVVRVYDLVESDEHIWLVMEYLPARSLGDIMRESKRLSPTYVALVGLAVVDALIAAHRAGVLHRDVTPENVLVGNDGRVALTDFGLAAWNPYDGRTLFDVNGSIPHYVAPERARRGVSIPEGDLWSLGATLYAAVEGRCPYARASLLDMITALVTLPPDPPVLAGPLTTVLCGLLQPDPRLRMGAPEARGLLLQARTGSLESTPTIVLRPRRQRLQSAQTVDL